MNAKFLIFCFIIPLSYLWSEPLKVIPNIRQSGIDGMDIYTDNSTGHTHFLWCDQNTGSICHIQILNSKQKSEPNCIYPTNQVFSQCLYEVDMHGLHDSKHIFAVFSGLNNAQNQDVFFIETSDDGKTWSKPISVSQVQTHDTLNRTHPNIILNSHTKRVYVTYKINDSGETVLKFVTRAPNSEYFSKEAKISGNYDIDYGTFLVFNQQKMPIINIWSVRTQSKLGIIRTQNGGVTWQNEKSWEGYCKKETDKILYVLTDEQAIPNSVMSQCIAENGEYYIRVSDNFGFDWNYDIVTNKIMLQNGNPNMCGNLENINDAFIIFTYKENDQDYVGLLSKNIQKPIISLKGPNEGKILDFHTTNCFMRENKPVVRLIVFEKQKNSEDLFDMMIYENNE